MLRQEFSPLRRPRYLPRPRAAANSTAAYGGRAFYGSTLRWPQPTLRLEETDGADPANPKQPPPDGVTLDNMNLDDLPRGSDTSTPPQQPPTDA